MTRTPLLRLATAALCLAATAPAAAQRTDAAAVRRMTIIREQTVIRVPLRPLPIVPLPSPAAEWKEVRGPKCLDRASIAGAMLFNSKAVDFILRDQTRMRARLQNSCPALDYYAGFYLKPTADGRICQDRDAVHARTGGECRIERFRMLRSR